MARKKITLAYIPNEATRRATLKKRRSGILKKAEELSILCGVDVCAIVYAGEEAAVFPPAPEKAKEILMEMRRMPDAEKKKKMVDQRSFLEQRHYRLSQQVLRLEHENAELAAAVLFRDCLGGRRPADSLGKEEAHALLDLLERKAKAVQDRMHQLGAANLSPPLLLPAPPLPMDLPFPIMASPMSAVEDPKEKLNFETVAMHAMRRCNWIDETVGGPPLLPGGDGELLQYGQGTMIGCSGGGGAPDDLLAVFMNNKFSYDGVFPHF